MSNRVSTVGSILLSSFFLSSLISNFFFTSRIGKISFNLDRFGQSNRYTSTESAAGVDSANRIAPAQPNRSILFLSCTESVSIFVDSEIEYPCLHMPKRQRSFDLIDPNRSWDIWLIGPNDSSDSVSHISSAPLSLMSETHLVGNEPPSPAILMIDSVAQEFT